MGYLWATLKLKEEKHTTTLIKSPRVYFTLDDFEIGPAGFISGDIQTKLHCLDNLLQNQQV